MTDSHRPRVYFAAPLFTHAERRWNAEVAAGLEQAGFDVWLPQDVGQTDPTDQANTATSLFEAAITGVEQADVVVAILDGADPDSGTCFECGYAFATGKPIIGVRTDFRAGGDDSESAVNLMLSQSCRQTIVWPEGPSAQTDVEGCVDRIAAAVRQALREIPG